MFLHIPKKKKHKKQLKLSTRKGKIQLHCIKLIEIKNKLQKYSRRTGTTLRSTCSHLRG